MTTEAGSWGWAIFQRPSNLELASRRSAVNVVAPGAIQPDFKGSMARDNRDINRQVPQVSARGQPGVPDDIGPMTGSRLCEDNRWVNVRRTEVYRRNNELEASKRTASRRQARRR